MSQTKRDVVLQALRFESPEYVPWAWDMTLQCQQNLKDYLGRDDLDAFIGSHFFDVGSTIGRFEKLDEDTFRDVYGVTWDRSIDKDIGTPSDWPIREPDDLETYEFPDATDAGWYAGLDEALAGAADRFRRYTIGFSMYERAWTLRGMTGLLMDMVERPEFVEELMDRICEHNLVQIHRALEMDIDCVHFGDDYGMQTGLIMGLENWQRFIKPRLERMFRPVREAGKVVSMHSCGCVEVLFDDLIDIGLNLFNPFQPEVMDVDEVKRKYHGKLAFHGGMSVQKILPFGSVEDVKTQAAHLLELGRDGGYVFSPSHSVPPDVPPENLVAMMEVVRAQSGSPG